MSCSSGWEVPASGCCVLTQAECRSIVFGGSIEITALELSCSQSKQCRDSCEIVTTRPGLLSG